MNFQISEVCLLYLFWNNCTSCTARAKIKRHIWRYVNMRASILFLMVLFGQNVKSHWRIDFEPWRQLSPIHGCFWRLLAPRLTQPASRTVSHYHYFQSVLLVLVIQASHNYSYTTLDEPFDVCHNPCHRIGCAVHSSPRRVSIVPILKPK